MTKIAFLSALTAACGLAQVTGALSGYVQDASGQPVAGARVIVYLAGSDVEDSATTTSDAGLYQFPVLRPTFYRIAVEAANFKRALVDNVKIDPLQETALPPVKLEIGEKRESIEVHPPLQTLDTSDGQVADTLTSQQIAELPLFESDPLKLLDTMPGVVSNGRSGSYLTIDGQPASFSNVTYDGVNIQTSFIRTTVLNETTLGLHTDQISEATIVTVNPSSAYSGGATQVAFSTPTGTGSSSLHGNVYWRYVPSDLQSQYWMDNRFDTPADTKINQFGGSFSGPIRKNKIFFYVNYEALLDRSSVADLASVPSSPPSFSDPDLSKVSQLFPAPNGTFAGWDRYGNAYSYNYRGNQNNHETMQIGLGRLDYIASDRNTFALAYSVLNQQIDMPGYGFGSQPNNYEDDATNFYSAAWRWTPGPHVTNEVRIGANLPSIDFRNRLRSDFPFVLEDICTAGCDYSYSNPMASIDPQGRDDYVYNYQDNLHVAIGAQLLQAGVSLQNYRLSSYGINSAAVPSYNVPAYYVAPLTAPNVLDVWALQQAYVLENSSLNSYTTGSLPKSKLSANLWSGYFQDNWKVTPGLSLNVGVRYDYLSPPVESTGTAILPIVSSGSSLYSSLYDSNLAFRFAGSGQQLYNPDRKDWSPYFGLAWNPIRGRRSFVVRGAYSLSYVNDDLLRTTSSLAYSNPFQGIAPVCLNIGSLQSPSASCVNLPTALTLPNLVQNVGYNLFEAVSPNLATPHLEQWNVGIEGEVHDFIIAARYVGNRLHDGIRGIDANQIMLPSAYLATYNPNNEYGWACGDQAALCARTLQIQGPPNGYTGPLPPNYTFFNNPSAPYGIELLTNQGRSHYEALQLLVTRRVSRGLTFTANYTYSKNLSNMNDYLQGAYDPHLDNNNPGLDWTISPLDLRQAFKTTWVYDLPFGKNMRFSGGRLAPLIGNWSISGVAIVQSGAPFSIMSGLQTLVTGSSALYRNTAFSSLSGSQINNDLGLTFDGYGPSFINSAATSAITDPPAGANGNLPLRGFAGPWQAGWDLGIRKSFPIAEHQNAEFRMEFFNIQNTVNWVVNDQYVYYGSAFGRDIFQSNQPRRIQFALRYNF